MHLKKQRIPNNWPIQRKGTAFVVRPLSRADRGLPLGVIIRDVLKLAQNKKEVKRAIYMGELLINQRPARDVKESLGLYDKMTVVPSKKSYKIVLSEKGKFDVKEIKDNDAQTKLSKIINKKVLRGKKTQLNLIDGTNFLSEIKCEVNDSVKIDFKERKVIECVPLREKTKTIVFAGKHAGKEGVISKINRDNKMAELEVGKDKINVLIKQIMVAE